MPVTIEPATATVPAVGGTSTHTLTNFEAGKIMFKIKSSNNNEYRLKPVFGFIEAGATAQVEITRLAGPPKEDKLVVQFAPAPQGATDAQEAFKGAIAAADVTLPVKAVEARVFEPVNVKYQRMKLGVQRQMSTTRPTRITVIPGKIGFATTENKPRFAPFEVKTTDIIRRPSLPRSGRVTFFLFLDFVENIDAKFSWITLQVDPSEIHELLRTLLHAWEGTSSAVSTDDSSEPLLNTAIENSPVPAKTRRLHSPAGAKKSTERGHSREEPATSKGHSAPSSSTPTFSIPWLSEKHASRESAKQQLHATSVTTPAVAAMKESDGLQAAKEYKEVHSEFGLMADDVFKMDKKEREDLVKKVKTLVNETVNRKMS